MVILAVNVLNAYQRGDNKLDIVFDVRLTSILNGIAAGFLLGFIAVVLTSVRIARMNIIAAIRDLEPARDSRPRRRLAVASAIATGLLAAASVPALVSSAGAAVYLLPALTAVAAIPLLRTVMSARTATAGVAFAVLAWGLTAQLVRPALFDHASTAVYVVMGTMLSFAAVVLLSLYQRVVLRPLRPVINRPSESGLAARLASSRPGPGNQSRKSAGGSDTPVSIATRGSCPRGGSGSYRSPRVTR